MRAFGSMVKGDAGKPAIICSCAAHAIIAALSLVNSRGGKCSSHPCFSQSACIAKRNPRFAATPPLTPKTFWKPQKLSFFSFRFEKSSQLFSKLHKNWESMSCRLQNLLVRRSTRLKFFKFRFLFFCYLPTFRFVLLSISVTSKKSPNIDTVAQNWFHYKSCPKLFYYKKVLKMWAIWAK